MRRAASLVWRVVLLTCAASVQAAETDNFTQRPINLPDAVQVLNLEVNARLAAAVDAANAPPEIDDDLFRPGSFEGCDADRLYEAVGEKFAGFVFGAIERYAEQLPPRFRHSVALPQSVYQDLDFLDAPTLVAHGRLAPTLRIGGQLLGADKLGHFFSDGWAYFDNHYRQGLSLHLTLLRGELTELSYFGTLVTGIFSYADLVANFHGMRFWNALLGRYPDPLTGLPPAPYVRCVDGRFVLMRRFDWREYVDAGWDEAVNCNRYANDHIAARVMARIEAVNRDACRTPHPALIRLRPWYGALGPRLLNPSGGVVAEPLLRKIDEYLSTLAGDTPVGYDRDGPTDVSAAN